MIVISELVGTNISVRSIVTSPGVGASYVIFIPQTVPHDIFTIHENARFAGMIS